MKLYKLIGFSYVVAEIIHYYKSLRRYNHFEKLRIKTNEHEINEFNESIDLTENNRATILNDFIEVDHKNIQICTRIPHPSNKLRCRDSTLYWRHWPFFMEFICIIIRHLGEHNLRRIGYKKQQYLTTDGYYNIWTRYVNDTKPLLFFPGLGLGGIKYANFLHHFNRTTHIIEVPNFGYATPYSDSQATGQTLFEIIQKIDTPPRDIIAHSMGTLHCAHYINECINQNETSSKKLILMDCFSTKYDILNSHLLPFLGYDDYNNLISIKNTQTKPNRLLYNLMLYLLTHQIDSQSFCKRYHSFHSGVFWRDYKNIIFKYIFSGNEIMMDTHYIISKLNKDDYYFIEKGQHGSCVFGKKRNFTIDTIKNWLT